MAASNPRSFPGIWFEQVIQQNVSPQIDGLVIKEVPLDTARTRIAIVLTIPAAQGRAPHQAKDGRYYRRHNFGNLIVNDSEIRDTMRRATTPELFVALRLGNMQQAKVDFAPQEGNLKADAASRAYRKPIAATGLTRDRFNRARPRFAAFNISTRL